MLQCLNTFRDTPSDALATVEELLAKQLAHALDAVTIVDIGIAHADAVVERLEQTRDELQAFVNEAKQHIELSSQRCHSDWNTLRRLVSSHKMPFAKISITTSKQVQKRQEQLSEATREIRVDLEDANNLLEDVDERIRVARETLASMNSLQLLQIPSPLGYDLKVLAINNSITRTSKRCPQELGAERRQIANRVDMCLTLESSASDSLDSVSELIQMLQLAADGADRFGRMADLVGKIGLNRVTSPRRRSNDMDQQTMLAVINSLAADRMLQSKLKTVISQTEEARAAAALRIVEIISRFWR